MFHLKEFKNVEVEHDALWVQEAEARYVEIKDGKLDCQTFPEVMRELRVCLTPAQTQELDVRLEAYRRNPDAGSPWQDVRNRISGNRD